jgi:phage terminase large subunit
MCTHNKTEHTITLGSNWLLFAGIDDPERIKSSEFNYIWMEEANEFNYEDYLQCSLRLSGPKEDNEVNRIYLSFNPSDPYSYVNELIELPEAKLIHSTYLDNPFLPESYKKLLLSLKVKDEDSYKIYALGEDAEIKGQIYKPYIIEIYGVKCEEYIYGLDFGFNNPTALVEVGIKDGELYLKEKLYKTEITNSDLIKKLPRLIKNKTDCIYADSAEPNRIEEISRAGWNIYPADKDVNAGIDFAKQFNIHTWGDNVNLLKERKNYKYQKDKNGNYLEKPLKFLDHLMDAKRYAIYTHLKGRVPSTAEIISGDSIYKNQYYL